MKGEKTMLKVNMRTGETDEVVSELDPDQVTIVES